MTKLKKWEIGRTDKGNYFLRGEIYDDEKGRFKDGTPIKTSNLKNIDFEANTAETKNTVYQLD